MRETDKRPVSAVADHTEVREVTEVSVAEDTSLAVNILFDADRSLEERIIAEQFVTG
jgi:NAD+ kinase